MSDGSPTADQVLRLAVAYGLAPDRENRPKRPQYVPYSEDVGTGEAEDTPLDARKIASKLWAMGYSIRRIALALGVDFQTVKAWVCRNRDLFPYRRGPYAKRTEDGE